MSYFAPRGPNTEFVRAPRRWLGDDGAFLFGKYKGDLVEDVAREDPDYLRWITQTVEDIDEDDLRVIEQSLRLRRR